MRADGFAMLALLIVGLGLVNLALLARLWRDGRVRRKALRDRLDTLSVPGRVRTRRRHD